MSKVAKDNARKLKRTPDTVRMIICEEVFDIRTGSLGIAVYHPKSETSFAILSADLPPLNASGYFLALKKSIWCEASKHIKPEKAMSKITGQGFIQSALF